jgi:hypothetical protein
MIKLKDLIPENIEVLGESAVLNNLKKLCTSFAFLALISSCALQKNQADLNNMHQLKPLDKDNIEKVIKIRSDLKKIITNNTDFDSTLKAKIYSKIDSLEFVVSTDNSIQQVAGHIKNTNTIMVNANVLNDDSAIVKNCLTHEMLHAIKEMNVLKDTMSKQIHPDILQAMQNRMSFQQSMKKHFIKLVDEFYESDENNKRLVDNLTSHYTYNRISYIVSNEEIFVRCINFKLWLIQQGQMTNLSDTIENDHISYFLNKSVTDKLDGTDMFDFVAVCKF